MAQDFSFGPVSARAPLHARPWSEKPRQACTLLPILETALASLDTSTPQYKTGAPAMFALSRSKFAAMLIACGLLATSSAGVHAQPLQASMLSRLPTKRVSRQTCAVVDL